MNEIKQPILIQSEEELTKTLKQEETVILYITTPTCGVCSAIFPKIQRTVSDFSFPFLKLDASKHTKASAQHNVFTVPTVLIFHEGKEVLRESRFIDVDRIERMLNNLT
jgi:thioredoxin-like negative regulator of GroEL